MKAETRNVIIALVTIVVALVGGWLAFHAGYAVGSH